MSWQSWQKVLTGALLAVLGAGGASGLEYLLAHLAELSLSPAATAFLGALISVLINTLRKWSSEPLEF